jgi:hypothetical protein
MSILRSLTYAAHITILCFMHSIYRISLIRSAIIWWECHAYIFFYITDTHLAIWAVVIFIYHNTRFTPLCIIVRNMQPFRHTQHSCTTHIYWFFIKLIYTATDSRVDIFYIYTWQLVHAYTCMIYHTYAEYIFYLTDNRYFIYMHRS